MVPSGNQKTGRTYIFYKISFSRNDSDSNQLLLPVVHRNNSLLSHLAEEIEMSYNLQLRRIVGDANRNLVHNFRGFLDGWRDYPDFRGTACSATDVSEQRAIHGAHFGHVRSR